MRRAEVEKAVHYVLTHPLKIDAVLSSRQAYIPWKVDFTPEEWDYFDQLVWEDSKNLKEWPKPTIM